MHSLLYYDLPFVKLKGKPYSKICAGDGSLNFSCVLDPLAKDR